jgi:hypothetical protein
LCEVLAAAAAAAAAVKAHAAEAAGMQPGPILLRSLVKVWTADKMH